VVSHVHEVDVKAPIDGLDLSTSVGLPLPHGRRRNRELAIHVPRYERAASPSPRHPPRPASTIRFGWHARPRPRMRPPTCVLVFSSVPRKSENPGSSDGSRAGRGPIGLELAVDNYRFPPPGAPNFLGLFFTKFSTLRLLVDPPRAIPGANRPTAPATIRLPIHVSGKASKMRRSP